jgi:hypothetical protein
MKFQKEIEVKKKTFERRLGETRRRNSMTSLENSVDLSSESSLMIGTGFYFFIYLRIIKYKLIVIFIYYNTEDEDQRKKTESPLSTILKPSRIRLGRSSPLFKHRFAFIFEFY